MEDRIVGGVTCSVSCETTGDGIDNKMVRRVIVTANVDQRRSTIEMPLDDMTDAGLTDDILADAAASALETLISDKQYD